MPRSRRKTAPQLPVVFLGPSLGHQEARKILEADYRRPIRRGDLGSVPANSIVAIIDGVFDQDLSVSPAEIRAALSRNIRIFGASSMGALRAVEVPGITGVGRVYEMYRTGAIDGDDEVALVFDPESMRPLCEPLVNIRHAVDRLARPGTISRQLAAAIVSAARKLSYFDRTYPLILKEAGVIDSQQSFHLATMLVSFDLKREDAITLLETLRDVRLDHSPVRDNNNRADHGAITREAPSTDYVHCWEFGPPVLFSRVVEFMGLTGTLPNYALMAQARLNSSEVAPLPDFPAQDLVERHLAQAARTWHWATQEEVDTSLEDLGLRQQQIQKALAARAQLELTTIAAIRSRSPELLEALRIDLFFDDLALKRETARTVSLDWLASRGKPLNGDASAEEIAWAKNKLCRLLNTRDVREAVEIAGWWGVDAATVEEFVKKLALAKRLAFPPKPVTVLRKRHSWLRATKKAPGSKRFCTSLSEAHSTLKKLKQVVGITRVGVITGLGTIGIPNAQAFRPDGEWSSTVGSGKSESITGAKVGAIMEEIEKWAQEKFTIDANAGINGHPQNISSFRDLVKRGEKAIDPSSLDLPYDSCYSEKLEMEWRQCDDLITGSTVLVPTAAITHRRVTNDIYYSSRGGRKTITTNGLASGMTMAEALTHALCEYIERHALVLDSISDGNPGSPTAQPRPAVNLETTPASTRRLLGKITRAGYRLEVREITSEIRVPTFNSMIYLPEGSMAGPLFHDDLQRASGWAAHPDPETAINMSILEASQTIMTHVAGAREDLVLQARSLGRHERTDSRRSSAFARELAQDGPKRNFADIEGLRSDDAAEDVRWVLKQIAAAGYHHAIVADYSTREIKPVRVVRAIIPGLETINPFHTGVRGRIAILSDLI
jgi:ribosomal protein S12 methylthiotransferase accessory factor